MQPWERLSCHNQLLLVFKPTLLKPFGIKSTLVPLRNERQLKSFGISEDKKELVWSKLQKNHFLPIATPFTAQEIWMFDENIEKKKCSNCYGWGNLHQHTMEQIAALLCCFKGVANSQACSQGKHLQISCS